MRHKIGDTKLDISREQALSLHNVYNSCSEPHIINKPLARIEKTNIFSKKFYIEKCWQCLNCKWESEKMRTRTA